MADSANGGSKFEPPKEMSMEMRLLIALLLTVPILFIGPYFFGSQTPPPKKNTAPSVVNTAASPAEKPAAAEPVTPKVALKTGAASLTGTATEEQALPSMVIHTDLYR